MVVKGEGIRRYTSELEGAVYFCCLEALQNVSKYAQAEHVNLRLWEDDGILAFEVSDDGIGFEPETVARGTGLQNMSDRIEALGGNLELRSMPGEGTLVAGRIPATPAEAPSADDSIPAASPASA